jgi:FMN-dependent NADH-azoreductase
MFRFPKGEGAMSDLLFVNSSPRGERSESLRLAEALLAAYGELAPDAAIDRLDLFDDPLPTFGPQAAAAKMTVVAGEALPEREAAVWEELGAVFARLADAERLVFTVPMWNASIPWSLKLLIDVVTQPGLAFSFDPQTGYSGLLERKRAVAIYTSHVYHPGVDERFGVDFHSTYFEYWLRSVGITEVQAVRLQPSYRTADFDQRQAIALAEARAPGRALARPRIAEAA